MRAWDTTRPLLIAPAMNTHMWLHPLTAVHLTSLATLQPHVQVVEPVDKVLMCGDRGVGGMAGVEEIVGRVMRRVRPRSGSVPMPVAVPVPRNSDDVL